MSAPPTDDDEEPIKIILLGDSATGKSKLVERYLVDNYAQHQLSTCVATPPSGARARTSRLRSSPHARATPAAVARVQVRAHALS